MDNSIQSLLFVIEESSRRVAALSAELEEVTASKAGTTLKDLTSECDTLSRSLGRLATYADELDKEEAAKGPPAPKSHYDWLYCLPLITDLCQRGVCADCGGINPR